MLPLNMFHFFHLVKGGSCRLAQSLMNIGLIFMGCKGEKLSNLVPPCSSQWLHRMSHMSMIVNVFMRKNGTYTCIIVWSCVCICVCVFSSCTGHIPRFPFRVPRFPISWSPSAPVAPGGGHLNSLFRYSPSPRRLPAIFVAEDLSLPLPRCASGYGLERSPSDQKKWRLVYLVSQDLHDPNFWRISHSVRFSHKSLC